MSGHFKIEQYALHKYGDKALYKITNFVPLTNDNEPWFEVTRVEDGEVYVATLNDLIMRFEVLPDQEAARILYDKNEGGTR